jgi:hypothetical protein
MASKSITMLSKIGSVTEGNTGNLMFSGPKATDLELLD